MTAKTEMITHKWGW